MATKTKTLMPKNKIRATGSDRITDIVINVFMVVMCIFAIYPLWFTLIASISHPQYVNRGEIWLYPKDIMFTGYTSLLRNSQLIRGYGNTIFYTTAGTLAQLAVIMPTAFVMSRPKFPGKGWITTFLMIPMYFGGGMIPSYLLMKDLGLMNNILIFIIPQGCAFYYVLITKNYLAGNIPESLFESARIDGATTTQYFFKFVIPLSKPIVSVLTLYNAIPKWNDYMTSIMYIQDYKKHSLQVVIRSMMENIDSTAIDIFDKATQEKMMLAHQLQKYAIVLIGAVPLMLLYPAVQKYLIGGVMLGAVKE